jgi:hypothetical protein
MKSKYFTLYLYLLFSFAGIGVKLQAQSCIGVKGEIKWQLFENISGTDINALFVSPRFPQNPTWSEELNNLTTTTRFSSGYNNNYGSLIRGYINAPETGNYQFNLTGDDRTIFYLSTDSSTGNLTLCAEVPGWAGSTEYNKYPEQTSALKSLVAGNYYYFEVKHKEGGGGDHIKVNWKTPSTLGLPDWAVVPDSSVYGAACAVQCEDAGTPCDDGNPATSDDRYDGNCHCIGIPAALPFPCIGERGYLTAFYYDTINGSTVSNLLLNPAFPNQPDRSQVLRVLKGPGTAATLYGTRIRGYLLAPETGMYQFNVTGDNEVILRLSPNATTNSSDQIASNNGYAATYSHNSYPQQTSDSILLTAGAFYSIELLHKQNTGSSHYQVYWKTPFARDASWHLLDGTYLYNFDYDCETACIPNGTPCNDGNANTFDDKYNNCACAGTPCSDPACTNSLDYTPYAACENQTERHSTNPNSSWLSCEPSQSPNPERGVSHWIRYDLGALYELSDAKIWNYNAANASHQGFKEVAIDYSLNGTNWSPLGNFTWEQATGTGAYSGFDFAAFNGISARFILITALSNFAGSGCSGLSEFTLEATTCPPAGTPCDDGNPQTDNDVYNAFCTCSGNYNLNNHCTEIDLLIEDVPIASAKYTAQLKITSTGLVRSGSNVVFLAGDLVTLSAGFEVKYGAEFLADTEPCEETSVRRKKKQRKRPLN